MSRFTLRLRTLATISRVPSAATSETDRETMATGVKSSHPYPASAEAIERAGLSTTAQLYEVFTENSAEIQVNRLITVSSSEYRIRGIGEWQNGSGSYLHLLIEEE